MSCVLTSVVATGLHYTISVTPTVTSHCHTQEVQVSSNDKKFQKEHFIKARRLFVKARLVLLVVRAQVSVAGDFGSWTLTDCGWCVSSE